MRFDTWPDLKVNRKPKYQYPWTMGIIILLIIILMILFLFVPGEATVWDDGWEPDINVIFRPKDNNGFMTFVPFLKGEYFFVELRQDIPIQKQINRIIAFEILIHYIVGDQIQIKSVPEPISMVLLGSGIVGLIVIRRKISGSLKRN